MDVNEITTLLGWCTVLNMGVLAVAATFLYLFKGLVIDIHSKLTGVSITELPTLYFSFMANYKLGILLFNFVPYIALKIMV
ncbi:DUF6868 family protein [Colwellia piezophila]|uniref:DUF6868 family protein n=1 Tax=Colwellia piezophila TaxID=211668 RepID=UPI0003643CCC|nr:hypothetical protein [Colwellia piezophila]